jgi:hypothetical protein
VAERQSGVVGHRLLARACSSQPESPGRLPFRPARSRRGLSVRSDAAPRSPARSMSGRSHDGSSGARAAEGGEPADLWCSFDAPFDATRVAWLSVRCGRAVGSRWGACDRRLQRLHGGIPHAKSVLSSGDQQSAARGGTRGHIDVCSSVWALAKGIDFRADVCSMTLSRRGLVHDWCWARCERPVRP